MTEPESEPESEPDSGSESTDPTAVVAFFFRQRYSDDLARGAPCPLEEYQSMYRGFESVVSREYARAQATCVPDAGGSPGSGRRHRAAAAAEPAAGESGLDDAGEGKIIGPYRVVRELGRGGQGVVYLAVDSRLSRRVALKVLGESSISPAGLERFRREAELAAGLDHPGIAAVLDTGTDRGLSYIAMRFVEGQPLSKVIEATRAGLREEGTSSAIRLDLLAAGSTTADDGGGSPDGAAGAGSRTGSSTSTGRRAVLDAVRLIESAARALHRAHEAGVVHRDIKPGNIMVTPSAEPVILDFGLARAEESDLSTLTRTGDLFGTPAYMSPEQLEREPHRLDRRTDVYSLAVCLYECLTLRRPFEAPTRQALFLAIERIDPPNPRVYNPHVQDDLRVVLETALDKDPDRRYQTALELAEELRRVREFEPIRARPAGPALKLRRWAQRNRGVALSLGAALLFLVAGFLSSVVMWVRAEDNAHQAGLERDEKAAALASYEQMSDAHVAEKLFADEPTLWPRRAAIVPALADWLREARALVGRRGLHQRALDELRERRGRPAASAGTGGGGQPDPGRGYAFEDARDAWRHQILVGLVEDCDRLPALIDAVEARLDFCRNIAAVSIDAERAAWDACVADVAENPRYGFELARRVGLVPLGKDRDSGLWEFWHVGSGARPDWDGDLAAGKVAYHDDSGIVLVLIPGGSFWMGAQSVDPQGRQYDPQATGNEEPVHRVELRPFFLSKYEMTQHQWIAIDGTNPSYYQPGRHTSNRGIDVTPRHPVERVSWNEGGRVLGKLGLVLPTEAQWEYACRAGTTTRFYSGDDIMTLAGHANLADAISGRYFSAGWPHEEVFGDAFDLHAPVGMLAPNPFGLHDMHGNVREWCRDDYVDYRRIPDEVPRDPDGFTENAGQLLIHRGGSWTDRGDLTRSSSRVRSSTEYRVEALGVRPVMAID